MWLFDGLVTSHYLQDLDLRGFKNLVGLALLPARNEKLHGLMLFCCFNCTVFKNGSKTNP